MPYKQSHRDKYLEHVPFSLKETPLETLLRENGLQKKDLARLLGNTKSLISYINLQRSPFPEEKLVKLIIQHKFKITSVVDYIMRTSLWRCNKELRGKLPLPEEKELQYLKENILECLIKKIQKKQRS